MTRREFAEQLQRKQINHGNESLHDYCHFLTREIAEDIIASVSDTNHGGYLAMERDSFMSLNISDILFDNSNDIRNFEFSIFVNHYELWMWVTNLYITNWGNPSLYDEAPYLSDISQLGRDELRRSLYHYPDNEETTDVDFEESEETPQPISRAERQRIREEASRMEIDEMDFTQYDILIDSHLNKKKEQDKNLSLVKYRFLLKYGEELKRFFTQNRIGVNQREGERSAVHALNRIDETNRTLYNKMTSIMNNYANTFELDHLLFDGGLSMDHLPILEAAINQFKDYTKPNPIIKFPEHLFTPEVYSKIPESVSRKDILLSSINFNGTDIITMTSPDPKRLEEFKKEVLEVIISEYLISDNMLEQHLIHEEGKKKETIEEKFAENFKTIDSLMDFHFGENWSMRKVTEDPKRADTKYKEYIIYFPEITLSNTGRKTHTIQDLFVQINFRADGSLFPGFYGGRTTQTVDEYIANYIHSHLTTHNLANGGFHSFCIGTGQPMGTVLALMQAKYDPLAIESFLVQLPEYLSWESREGTPYIHYDKIVSQEAYRQISPQSLSQIANQATAYIFQGGLGYYDYVIFNSLEYAVNNTEDFKQLTPTNESVENYLKTVDIDTRYKVYIDGKNQYYQTGTNSGSNRNIDAQLRGDATFKTLYEGREKLSNITFKGKRIPFKLLKTGVSQVMQEIVNPELVKLVKHIIVNKIN